MRWRAQTERERIPSRLWAVCTEPNVRLNLTTVRSWPELNSRVRHLTNWAIQVPQYCNHFIWIFWGYGMNHLSFHYFLWGSSLWYTSTLYYKHVSGMTYTRKPRFYTVLQKLQHSWLCLVFILKWTKGGNDMNFERLKWILRTKWMKPFLSIGWDRKIRWLAQSKYS